MMSHSRILLLAAISTGLGACAEAPSEDALTPLDEAPIRSTAPRPTSALGSQPRAPAITPRLTTFSYSSLLLSAGTEIGSAIAVDGGGNAYITGTTTACGGTEVFVAKLGPSGAPVYAVCLFAGMSSNGIAVDSAGNAYIAAGSSVAKLDPTGTTLLWTATLGTWHLAGIALDSLGNSYVAGTLVATPGGQDVVVAKLNPGGTAFVYAVSFGGTGDDMGNKIAIDSAGNAYVVGTTMSTNFPLSNAWQATLHGSQDAFVTKLSSTGSQLLYSTYLGGNQLDYGNGIAVDNAGNAYVGGSTSSLNGVESFPVTTGAAQSFPPGGGDAYVAKLSSSGGLVYSTYVGGSGGDVGTGIAVDPSTGSAYLTGYTQSTNFPTAGSALQTGAQGGISDAFVTQLSPSGGSFSYSSYLGGASTDTGSEIAVDSSKRAYAAGSTFSTTFPAGTAHNSGDYDAYVVKLNGP